MLSVSKYGQDHVDHCRSRIDKQVAAYKKVKSAAGSDSKAIGSFEPLFFNNLVLVLDASFVHRARGQEGKDGNPLNEVRMLCESLLENDGVLGANKAIKHDPATSVLGLEVGDRIALSEPEFKKLSKAFFEEIENRFV